MKLLIVADIHIKLGQRKVPREWQAKRIIQLAKEINTHEVDVVVIAGDLLDVAKPSVDEVGLMLDFLASITNTKVIIPGNHEMVTKTKDCFIPLEGILKHLDTIVVREFDSETLKGVDLIPYNVLHKDFPETGNPIAITHVRGEIPPHVEPEIELDRLAHYDTVYAGDLHSKTNSQLNIKYPGSPFSTSFHRNPSNKGSTGMYIVDTSDGTDQWVQLDLPELLRFKVDSPEDMIADDTNVVIYELEGELEDLARVKDSDLLDKKVANNVFSEAQLDLEGGNLTDEVVEYLTKIKQVSPARVNELVSLLKEVLSK